jgi:cytochrome c-type biogenesis protein CcmH
MLAAGDDASRLKSLTGKVFCNCGCGEILSECSHTDCKAKASMKLEIATAVQGGGTDEAILDDLEKKYGRGVLVVPSFRGFNRLLWIVPVGFGVIATAIVVWRRWAGSRTAGT